MRILFVVFLFISTAVNAALPTPIDGQITDNVTQSNAKVLGGDSINITTNNPSQIITGSNSVTQTNVGVLGDAPGQAMGNLYQTVGN